MANITFGYLNDLLSLNISLDDYSVVLETGINAIDDKISKIANKLLELGCKDFYFYGDDEKRWHSIFDRIGMFNYKKDDFTTSSIDSITGLSVCKDNIFVLRLSAEFCWKDNKINLGTELSYKACAIEEFYNNHGISLCIDDTKTVTGPHYSTLTGIIERSDISLEEVEKLAYQMETELELGPILTAAFSYNKKIEIDILNNHPQKVTTKDILAIESDKHNDPFYIPLGLINNNEIGYYFMDYSCLLTSSSKNEKKQCIEAILTHLIKNTTRKDIKIVIYSQKERAYEIFDDAPQLVCPPLSDSYDCLRELHKAISEMNRCKKLAHEEVNTLPRLFIVIDEFSEIMLSEKDTFEKYIEILACEGWRYGIHILAATTNCEIQICFRV